MVVAGAMKTLLFLVCLWALCDGQREPQRPIQIVQLVPGDDSALTELIHLFETGDLDFWRAPTKVNATVDIMVDARQKADLEAFGAERGIPMNTIVPDLEDMIARKEGPNTWRAKALNTLRAGRRFDSIEAGNDDFGLDMAEYHSYDAIVAWMNRIVARLPTQARVFTIGKTVEGREIYGIKLSNPVGNPSKRVVWIDGGIHAREWTAVHTTAYFIYKTANLLLQRDPKIIAALSAIELVIFPVLNPDGYEYTRSNPTNALVRMWRKNRSLDRCGTNRRGEHQCCRGTDLNRNFAYRFSETGTSFHPCSEIYHGAAAFSEPETVAVRNAITQSDLTGRIEAYVTLHAYSQLFIYPFANQKKSYPADVADLKKVAQKAVSAISRLFGTHYLYGTGPEIIYAYTGGSSDWAKETAKIKYSYTIELRPSYYSWNGFVLDKAQLIPTARETYDGIMVVVDQVVSEATGTAAPAPAIPATVTPIRPALPQSQRTFAATPAVASQTTPAPLTTSSPLRRTLCQDTVESCSQWLHSNPTLCSTARHAMSRQCALSCGLCDRQLQQQQQ